MSLLKYIERVKRMDDLIRRKTTGTPEEFANKLNISRSQLLQDLKEFKQLGAPVEYCSIRGTYQYAKDCPTLFDFRTDKIYGGLTTSMAKNIHCMNEHTAMQYRNGFIPLSRLYFCLLLSFLLVSCSFCKAQISGTVREATTHKPLAGVEIFLNQTTKSTKSNEKGEFYLDNTPAGFYELILFKDGHTLYRSSLKIQKDRAYTLNLSLAASKKQKEKKLTVEEKSEIARALWGNTTEVYDVLASDIRINRGDNQQILASKEPIVYRQKETGYAIHGYLQSIPLQDISQAPVWYEPLPAASIEETILWEKERKKKFEGSQRHWLMALAAGKLQEEGYTLQDEKGMTIDPHSLLTPSSLPDYVKLTIPQALVLRYKNKEDVIETSRVSTQGAVDVHASGLLLNAKALTVTGDMMRVALANQLPIDYQPIAGEVEDTYAKTLEKFYEKIYVHTDKPYYYPGEALWFKGYIHYVEPAWRDSLSRVVYVELINPKKEITLSKTVKIDSGFFHNDIVLPDTLTAGTYYLRAYTNLNRNFGDSNLYVKPIPILHLKTKVDPALGKLEETNSPYLTVSTDKKVYKPREKITLTIQTRDKEGKPIAAHLSVSVTDAAQVIPIKETETIVTAFQQEKHPKATDLQYPVEYGVGFRGKFVNDNNKPEQTTLTILQMKPRNMLLATTDEQGIFSLTGLDFYDSALFSVKSDKAKDLPYGKVTILPREAAPMVFKESDVTLKVQETEFQQRIASEYEVPSDVHMLEEVEIKGSKIEAEPMLNYNLKRPYGKPDFILKKEDINSGYGNLLLELPGKIPGLVVREANDPIKGVIWVVYIERAGTNASISSPKEVTIMVNDAIMGGTPEQILSNLDPSTVESIELKKGINALYGSAGAFGVLSIYTYQNGGEDISRVGPNFQVIKTVGYSSLRRFMTPDYEAKDIDKLIVDYRSIIYWNPVITTSIGRETASAWFYAADRIGSYRIIAEGTTQNGEPARCEFSVEIKND